MKTSRTLLLLSFWPVLLVALFTIITAYWVLSSINQQSAKNHQQQLQDLIVVQDAAAFSQQIGSVHQSVAERIIEAKRGEISEVQLYRFHAQVVDELAVLADQVTLLVESELLREVNHGSVIKLQQAFQTYRRFVIMSTEIIAIDPKVAQDYLHQAEQHFIDFSVYIQRITFLLSERAALRNAESFINQQQFLYSVIVIGLLSLVVILLLILFLAGLVSRKILVIASTLSAMAKSDEPPKTMLEIEKMYATDRGEFGRIAGALISFWQADKKRKLAEAEAFQLAFYDPLTQLPNRRLLMERIDYSRSLNDLTSSFSAILLFDLDNFKTINDSQGHKAGDQLLVEVAERLVKREVITESHIARVGGDEFVVTLEGLGSDEASAAAKAEQLAESLREQLSQPYLLNSIPHFLTPSIGVVLFRGMEWSVEDLLKQAETAMYNAKSNGRNRVSFYDPFMQQVLVARALLESELRDAIEQNQFELYYQLQVDQQQKPTGAEALIRWHHPEKGRVSPADFIPLAEETGQIKTIGRWVLRTACDQLQQWQRDPATEFLSLSVNVSAQQFKEAGFVSEVSQIIENAQINPHRLKIELTESTVLDNMEEAVQKMNQLRKMGVQFSLDDFGTGYSSLQYLKRLPLDQIKIDQSFVQDIVDDQDDSIIVQTIIAMSAALGIDVIAEGVENQAQQHLLAEKGCRYYQGYLFGKPSKIDEFNQSLQAIL
ncbi:bifunctional diguanylate cyclase/phosphodiesterase [Thiomicrospira microaerophila]|uniref:putative bifunctional diguanylate cyclase/phosphodiesterase n=1 Tax=Thiomicrospira microaerophila TaxID=406020 RepID=UPI00200F4571|nr:bifunctional diguanylate cyclase/phosphodiesterase [Thiomicrospira microaerophila]UQB41912.1 bifunctional diguanylate cyclase/phosphodiesterase [Thiomicrospira microaerophila]